MAVIFIVFMLISFYYRNNVVSLTKIGYESLTKATAACDLDQHPYTSFSDLDEEQLFSGKDGLDGSGRGGYFRRLSGSVVSYFSEKQPEVPQLRLSNLTTECPPPVPLTTSILIQ